MCRSGSANVKEHAQQDSHIDSETTENTESLGNGSSSDRSQDLNLDNLTAILAALDPASLKVLLNRIQKECYPKDYKFGSNR